MPTDEPNVAERETVRRKTIFAEQSALEEYVADYVMSTEGADYEPTEHERDLIHDALQGWLTERKTLMVRHWPVVDPIQ